MVQLLERALFEHKMNKAISKLMNLTLGLSAICILTLLVSQIGTVVLRYVFSYGWSWTLDLSVYLFFLSVILPISTVIISDLSVRVDIFYSSWSVKRQAGVDRFALLLVFFPAVTYATYTLYKPMLTSWKLLESSPTIGGLPGYFILKTGLFLFFTALSLTSLVLGLRKIPFQKEGKK